LFQSLFITGNQSASSRTRYGAKEALYDFFLLRVLRIRIRGFFPKKNEMQYSTGIYYCFDHGHHIDWSCKRRLQGLQGGIWLRFRTFSVKFAQKKGIYNERDALSAQHVHIFV
jgi:hypothetical protein